jgi:hypothetical protein
MTRDCACRLGKIDAKSVGSSSPWRSETHPPIGGRNAGGHEARPTPHEVLTWWGGLHARQLLAAGITADPLIRSVSPASLPWIGRYPSGRRVHPPGGAPCLISTRRSRGRRSGRCGTRGRRPSGP